MKKIMFNDKFGLTDAVLEGHMTMTRRVVGNRMTEGDIKAYLKGYTELANKCAPYKIGEVVAVAQNYHDVYKELKRTHGSSSRVTREFFHKYVQGGRMPVSNKMFVRADLMPYQIRITNIKVENLQDISEEDCLNEGVYYDADVDSYKVFNLFLPNKGWGHKFRQTYFQTPREAFAALIDKISGKGTWKSNPFVFAYTFKFLK